MEISPELIRKTAGLAQIQIADGEVSDTVQSSCEIKHPLVFPYDPPLELTFLTPQNGDGAGLAPS